MTGPTYAEEDIVADDQKQRLGRVVIVRGPSPYLYGIQEAGGQGVGAYVYEADLRPANEFERRTFANLGTKSDA